MKGAANAFLYRFQQFMNLHRGNGDMLRWINRFQLSIQRMQEAWNDTYLPIVDVNNAEVRAFITGLPAEEQATITPEEAMERASDRLREQHARTIPITANLVALIFVSLSDLTQDQRQVLTSLMAHRNRVLADYRLNELREVYLEIFCTTKTSVHNPLLAPSGAPPPKGGGGLGGGVRNRAGPISFGGGSVWGGGVRTLTALMLHASQLPHFLTPSLLHSFTLSRPHCLTHSLALPLSLPTPSVLALRHSSTASIFFRCGATASEPQVYGVHAPLFGD